MARKVQRRGVLKKFNVDVDWKDKGFICVYNLLWKEWCGKVQGCQQARVNMIGKNEQQGKICWYKRWAGDLVWWKIHWEVGLEHMRELQNKRRRSKWEWSLLFMAYEKCHTTSVMWLHFNLSTLSISKLVLISLQVIELNFFILTNDNFSNKKGG